MGNILAGRLKLLDWNTEWERWNRKWVNVCSYT